MASADLAAGLPSRNAFSPIDLFADGVTTGGFWDCTDINNLFQDVACTIPCTPPFVTPAGAAAPNVLGIKDQSGGGHNMGSSFGVAQPLLGVASTQTDMRGFADYPRGQQLVYPYDVAPGYAPARPIYYVQIPITSSGGFTTVGGLTVGGSMPVGSNAGWYCMCVCRVESAATAQPLDSDFSGARIGQLIVTFSGTNLTFAGPVTFNSDGTSNALFASNAGFQIPAAPMVFSVRRMPDHTAFMINGKCTGSQFANKPPQVTNIGIMAIGAGDQGAGALSRQFLGRIYAALMVNRPISPTEELAVEEWALARCVL